MKSFSVSLFSLFVLLQGCANSGRPKSEPSTLSLRAQGWNITYSPNMPSHPSPSAAAAWQFDFPRTDGVHYVTGPFTSQTAPKSISMTFRITGTGTFTFPPNGCATPASVRLFIEQLGDNMESDFGRWWSNPASFKLGPTNSATLTVPVTPSQWSSVYGKMGTAAPKDFAEAMKNIGYVGMTFGGGCFFGHGVWVNGSARFILLDYRVQ